MYNLKISVLGPPEVRWEGDPISLPTPRIRALLYRLAVQDDPVPREHIGFLFWPRKSESTVRRQVAHICAQLRRALPERSVLTLRDGKIGLDQSLVWSDAVQFHQLAAECRCHPSVYGFGKLTSLYRGPLLCGFSLAGYPEYEAWITLARRVWEQDVLAALHALVEQTIREADYARAIAAVLRYLDIDPLCEEMHRCLIGLYGLSGDKVAANRQYGICTDLLRREQGRLPAPETTETYQAAMDGSIHHTQLMLSSSGQPLLSDRNLRRRQWQYESKPRRQKLLLF